MHQVTNPQHLSLIRSRPDDFMPDEEFAYNIQYSPKILAQACYEGYLPMATRQQDIEIWLLKLHFNRCIIYPLSDLHITKNVKKNSKKYFISVDTQFSQCVEKCRAQHDAHSECWLYPKLVAAYERFWNINPTGGAKFPVSFHSFELWKKVDDDRFDLVAGELGYVVGSCYTSLTGFCEESGAGTVQLAATGRILQDLGFTVWDLGMEVKYKYNLGAHLEPRNKWLEIQGEARKLKKLGFDALKERRSAYDVVYGKEEASKKREDLVKDEGSSSKRKKTDAASTAS
ncbi:hypothetical protein HK098_003926 [Nowakowskiella sp. JEL0407]|nr:hypothetical protein HK098_003926 [Nowakowskiella sp. JEL0407]